ncbi:hypothetical protein [Shewanella litorisediminis]|uniref:PilZ domain-containing protein n=1 Tax=Shewanella litorisediminis TaxID=1173586 RepID=A0ABX7G8E3_9GAMM|nr:hypothetical protein [Shewanella litorisediminis]MCL2916768.1 hypothetical protein [Shewanella litorisediminis]QRH03595.1 hypothetical protein JQC75_06560 [Shewanella litorisediminis]
MLADPNAYFSVTHDFNAYLQPFDGPMPNDAELLGMRSVGLQLLSDVKTLEAGCLLQLRQLDNEAKAVVDFLKLQSRKVDMVLHYVLENEQRDGKRHQGLSFGGSNILVESQGELRPGDLYKTTVYIRDELIALVCIARVASVSHEEGRELTELVYEAILEADVEHLVKASLSVQQKQLKARKQQAPRPPER